MAGVIQLGRATLAIIKQNYGLSIGVNSIGVVVGAAGQLNPFVAAVLHNASSLAVVLNSARLTRWQPPGRTTHPAPAGPPTPRAVSRTSAGGHA